MRLHGDGKQDLAPELITAGRELLRRFSFTEKNDREDYRIGEIAAAVMGGEDGNAAAQELCAKLKDAVGKYATHAFYHDDLLQGLLTGGSADFLGPQRFRTSAMLVNTSNAQPQIYQCRSINNDTGQDCDSGRCRALIANDLCSGSETMAGPLQSTMYARSLITAR